MPKTDLSDRELATVLAALRCLQESQEECDDLEEAWAEHFEDCDPLSMDEIDDLCDRLNAKPAPPTPESVMASAMEDRERKIEWDRVETEYALPDELAEYYRMGVVCIVNEKPDEKTVEFDIPGLAYRDENDEYAFTLTWIHPDHNAEFCQYYADVPGDLANFYLRKASMGHGDEDIDVPTLDDLIAWLADACDE